MRCAQAERLIDAFVDGMLDSGRSAALHEHAAGCARCAERTRLARGITGALLSAPGVKAPAGFAQRVMAGVYRQALSREPRRQAAAEPAVSGAAPGGSAARVYRRLGLSFLLTAGVLAISLLVPRASYPTLLGGPGAGIGRESATVVRGVLAGADDVVRGALGERTTERNAPGAPGKNAPGAPGRIAP